MKTRIFALCLGVMTIGAFFLYHFFLKEEKTTTKKTSHEKRVVDTHGKTFWTCPMHPQVRLDHAGECPICGMKLTEVKEKAQELAQEVTSETSLLSLSKSQLDLIGIQKITVEKMNLIYKIPVSGRVLSQSTVAFQIYENDVKYLRSGAAFQGNPESHISGTISSIDSLVDPTSRTVRVVGNVTKGNQDLLTEGSFYGDVIVPLKDRVAIPESAVLHTGRGDFVYAFTSENNVAPKKIKLGLKAEGFYEVLSGLKANEIITSGPNFLIDSEAKIRGLQ